MTGTDYNDETDMSSNFQPWLQVKRVNKPFKNDTVKKRGRGRI